jgi:hypothetical protein
VKNFFLYLRNSDLRLGLNLNPFRWHIYYHWFTYSDLDPGLILDTALTAGPITIAILIDDGRW